MVYFNEILCEIIPLKYSQVNNHVEFHPPKCKCNAFYFSISAILHAFLFQSHMSFIYFHRVNKIFLNILIL